MRRDSCLERAKGEMPQAQEVYDNSPTDRHIGAMDPQVGAADQRQNCLIPSVVVKES